MHQSQNHKGLEKLECSRFSSPFLFRHRLIYLILQPILSDVSTYFIRCIGLCYLNTTSLFQYNAVRTLRLDRALFV